MTRACLVFLEVGKCFPTLQCIFLLSTSACCDAKHCTWLCKKSIVCFLHHLFQSGPHVSINIPGRLEWNLKPIHLEWGKLDTKISCICYPMVTGVDGLDQCKFWMISKMNFPTLHDLSLIWWDVQGNAEEFASHSRGSFFLSSLCLCRFSNSGPWENGYLQKHTLVLMCSSQADIKLTLFIFILISSMGLCVFLLMQCPIEPFRTIGWLSHLARCAWADSLVFLQDYI